jgi:alpha-L-fucosidase 2
MKIKVLTTLLLVPVTLFCLISCKTIIREKPSETTQFDKYNVIWESPSKDASGQMPMGNGDIAAGVYAIEGGDLYLLLSKNDAYTSHGDIFKTGRVRVSLSPNPFVKGKPFRQTLDIETGSILLEANGVQLRIWADANRPLYHVEVDSPEEISVNAAPEFWERFETCGFNGFDATGNTLAKTKPTQDVRVDRNGHILWYYAVGDQSDYIADMKYYEVEDMMAKYPDPYRHNTFGNLLESPDLDLKEGTLSGKGKRFDIRIHALTEKTPDTSNWMDQIEQQAQQPINIEKDWLEHKKWWSNFWNKSWITVTDNTLLLEDREKFNGEGYRTQRTEKDGGALVAQSYNVFRYLMACQSRGKIQAKFNGGLFTQPLRCTEENKWKKVVTQQPDGTLLSHEDDRDWGRRFTYQNQRLLYWPLIMSGDFEMMHPFFDYYSNLLPVRKAITKAWFGHEGAYYRENIEPTGAERDCGRDGKPPRTKPGENKGEGYYHSYYFTSGLETLAMMIEYVKHSGDNSIRDTVLVPFAREVLLFFDKHYERDANGKIRLDPAMVLETYWIAVNPAPDIAGLQFCLDGLLEMEAGTVADQNNWQRFKKEVPDVALHEPNGQKAIAPAEKFEMKKNAENGELYPVFPFNLFGLAQGTEDIVTNTMKHRSSKNSFDYKCWTQDQIHWAYAGNAKEAQEGLVHRFRHASTQCRFPLYGSQGPDSCPDFDHFGSGSTALQRMLVQEDGDTILLLPAWPADWDTDFKLHLSKETVISGKVINGKLTEWSIEPKVRNKDVVVYKPQNRTELPD